MTIKVYPTGSGSLTPTMYDEESWDRTYEFQPIVGDLQRIHSVGSRRYYRFTSTPGLDYELIRVEVDVHHRTVTDRGTVESDYTVTERFYTSPTGPIPAIYEEYSTDAVYNAETSEYIKTLTTTVEITEARVYFNYIPTPPTREYISANAVVTQDEAVAQGCYATVNGSRGTVEVDCPIGSSVTLSLDAHAAGNYVFDHWRCNTARIEGGASTTYTALNDSGIEHLTFTATFRDRNGHVTVTAHVSPDEAKQAGASAFVNGVNSYTKECAQGAVASFELSAHPTDEWQFVAWIAGGQTFDDETATLNHRNVTGEDEVDATAYFEQVGEGILCTEDDGTILCTEDSGAVLCGG